jgi:hypothetical protein
VGKYTVDRTAEAWTPSPFQSPKKQKSNIKTRA